MPYIHFTEEQKRLAASVDLVEFLRQLDLPLQENVEKKIKIKYSYRSDLKSLLSF